MYLTWIFMGFSNPKLDRTWGIPPRNGKAVHTCPYYGSVHPGTQDPTGNSRHEASKITIQLVDSSISKSIIMAFIYYHLVMTNIAMEKSTIFKNGKPSISMGHRKTMAMLVITRGYISELQKYHEIRDGSPGCKGGMTTIQRPDDVYHPKADMR